MPNGRVMYALKSFTIKQLNRMWFDGVQEIRKGNYKKGTQQLMGYASLLMIGGMTTDTIKDAIMGRDQADLDDRAVANLWKVMGSNEYVVDLVKKGKTQEALYATVLPPMAPFAFQASSDIINPDKDWSDIAGWQTMNYVPVVGRFAYNWFGGGAERYNERLKKKEEEANKLKPIFEKKKKEDVFK